MELGPTKKIVETGVKRTKNKKDERPFGAKLMEAFEETKRKAEELGMAGEDGGP